MKRIILSILGAAGILFGLFSVYLWLRGHGVGCDEAEQYGKEADQMYQSYQAAIAKGAKDYELVSLKMKIQNKTKFANDYQDICAGSLASGRRALIIGILSGGVGLALFVSSFFIGRKKATLYPPAPAPY